MAFTKHVWDQLRATTVEQFISALERDGYARDKSAKGAVRVYLKKENQTTKRIVIHYHSGKTWGAKFLTGLIADAGWRDADLVRLWLVKKEEKKEDAVETLLVPCDCDGGLVEGKPCPICGGTRFKEVPMPPVV